jgi:hypothetical protein
MSKIEQITESTTLDAVFDVLRNPYRRRILEELSDHGSRDRDAFSVEEFTIDDEDLDEIQMVLYHTHLPKLATHSYIEWDPDIGKIRRGKNFDEIAPFLAAVVEHEDEPPSE